MNYLGDKSHPLAQNFLEHQRRSAKGYACPLCTDVYHQEQTLWDHALKNHLNLLGDLGSTEMANAVRKRFRQQALDKAQNKAKPDKLASTSADPPQAEPPSDCKDTGQLTGDKIRLPNISPSASPLGNMPGSGRNYYGRLTTNKPGKTAEQQEEPGYISNVGDHPSQSMFASQERLAEGNITTGQGTRVDDVAYRRPTSGVKPSLYHPTNDKELPRNQHGQSNQRPYGHSNERLSQPRRLHPPEPGGGDTDFEDSKVQFDPQQQDPYSSERTEQQFRLGTDQKNTGSVPSSVDDGPEVPDVQPEMLLQPETRPISHDQLVIEVKGIYAGLVMVEAKCIDIDEKQSTAAQEKDPSKKATLKNDQYQSLIALHKQLLHEHHDFFLASQHPAASAALSRLAAKYSMPARMWRHGIHAFLEVLRHRLPESLEHMLAFIYIAYSMMALLYETVPAFVDTWIECLGDLGRYRMAIEDDDPKDREVWSNVARFWYNKAADNSPRVGRLYHHLAILARPYSLEQLSLYIRALTCTIPFESARGSVMTLFSPILNGKDTFARRPTSLETILIKAHGVLFTSELLQSPERFDAVIQVLSKDDFLDSHIRKASTKFKENGVYAAIANIGALFEYGMSKLEGSKPVLQMAFDREVKRAKKEAEKEEENITMVSKEDTTRPSKADGSSRAELENITLNTPEASLLVISQASSLTFFTLSVCLRRPKDRNVYPSVHVNLVFLRSIVRLEEAGALLEKDIPRMDLCSFLNTLSVEFDAMNGKDRARAQSRLESAEFPKPEQGIGRPLFEDYILRGQRFTESYYPENWFSDAMVDHDERSVEMPSANESRVERILWLSYDIASANRWIYYDKEAKAFMPTDITKTVLAAQGQCDPGPLDEDSIMVDSVAIFHTPGTMSVAASDSYDSNIEFTPRTTSLAESESCDESIASTSAPTPMDLQASVRPPELSPPKSPDVEGYMEDTPMEDISPRKEHQSMSELSKVSEPKDAPWPPDRIVGPALSPHLREPRDGIAFGARKFHDLGDYEHEDAETYKP